MNRAFFLLTLALLPTLAQAQSETWTFMRSVGGMTIGSPQRAGKNWMLPIQADLSGLQAASERQQTMNSALACERTEAVVEGNRIYLTVISASAGEGRGARCPAAPLGAIPAGRYTVFYRGGDAAPVRLGKVSIPP